MKDVRLVSISWLDSGQATTGWQWLSKYQPVAPIRCLSVGFLIQDDAVKVLTQTLGDLDRDDNDCQAMGVIRIPAAAVLKIEQLTEADRVTAPQDAEGEVVA